MAELEAHFIGAGTISRVTIVCDKFTLIPKGFAYIEFDEVDSVKKALKNFDGSYFLGKLLQVRIIVFFFICC